MYQLGDLEGAAEVPGGSDSFSEGQGQETSLSGCAEGQGKYGRAMPSTEPSID